MVPEKYSKSVSTRFIWVGETIKTDSIWFVQGKTYTIYSNSDRRLDTIEDERRNHITRHELRLAKERVYGKEGNDRKEDHQEGTQNDR